MIGAVIAIQNETSPKFITLQKLERAIDLLKNKGILNTHSIVRKDQLTDLIWEAAYPFIKENPAN